MPPLQVIFLTEISGGGKQPQYLLKSLARTLELGSNHFSKFLPDTNDCKYKKNLWLMIASFTHRTLKVICHSCISGVFCHKYFQLEPAARLYA